VHYATHVEDVLAVALPALQVPAGAQPATPELVVSSEAA
jgi:hypothetical protein